MRRYLRIKKIEEENLVLLFFFLKRREYSEGTSSTGRSEIEKSF
jgi:hypothetical protein